MGEANALVSFAALLRRHRKELGHPNPHSFFEAQGGRRYFGCTYRAYLNAERGESIPKPAVVERLIAALWIAVDEAKSREFAQAYLRAVVGDAAFAEFLAEGAAPKPAPDVRLDTDDKQTVLKPEQARLLYRSEECYWCFTALSNDSGRWTAAELARFLDFSEKKVSAALLRLARAGLVDKGKDGRWSCPDLGKLLFHPKDRMYRAEDLAALRRHWERLGARHGGGLLQEHPVLTRCSEAELRQYFPYLMNALLASESLSRRQKTKDSGFFLLEMAAEKLVDF